MSGDYVYDMARMIDLAGGNLKSKRHARSKFMRDFPDHRTESFDDRHIPACLELLDLWVANGDATHEGEVNDAHVGTDLLRHRDVLASRTALELWRRARALNGLVLLVGDRLVGFTLGEALSASQAFILIEKTHPDYPAAPVHLLRVLPAGLVGISGVQRGRRLGHPQPALHQAELPADPDDQQVHADAAAGAGGGAGLQSAGRAGREPAAPGAFHSLGNASR